MGRERILRVAERVFRGLLGLYPRPFRERYGTEIVRAFSELSRERYRRAGLGGLVWLGLTSSWDTLGAAARERRDELGERFDERRSRRREGPFLSLAQDLRHALRSLVRQPAFSLVVVATLALGMGAATAIFSVIYAALLRPLPFAASDRVVVLRHVYAEGEEPWFSLHELEALAERSRTLEAVEEYHSMSFILLGDGAPEQVVAGVVSTGYFDLLGVEPVLGRTFRDSDVGEPVLVVSHDYWLERLAGDPGVVGRQVEMNDRSHTIVGVLPPLPAYPDANDVFMPTTSCPFRQRHVEQGNLDDRMTSLVARLAPGVTIAQAEAEAGRVVRELNEGVPRPPERRSRGVRISTVAEELARDARPTFLVLSAAVVFVLLIVCANAAHLVLTRLVRRERELAVRTALGAGRGRLVRQLMTENLLLAALAGLVGLALAGELVGRLAQLASRFTVRADEIRVDGAAFVFTLVTVLLTGAVLGALPLYPRCRSLVLALKDGSWGRFLGHGRQRLQRLLLVAQLAVSFVLLVGAGLMIRTVVKLQEVDLGFRTDDVVTMTLDLNWSTYDRPERYRAFFTRLLDRLAVTPGVESAAVAETFPLYQRDPQRGKVLIEGRTTDPGAPAPQAEFRAVSMEYFATLGIELVGGRGFGCGDDLDAAPVVIVNRSLSRHYFGGEDPLGRRISLDEGETWRTIVGVAGDVKQHGLASQVKDEVYAPFGQSVSRVMTVLVRTRADPRRVARQMWEAVSEIDSRQAIAHLRTLEQIRRDSLAPPRVTTALLASFALLSLGLTAAGVCGAFGFFVRQRTHEIGVRMALGAGRRAVLHMVMGEGMALALAGLVLGLGGAFALSGAMSQLLFEVRPTDPWTFFATALLLLGVAAVSCYVPARWATNVQPVAALRQE